MNRNKKLERAIEIGVERLRGSLYEKECEIRQKLLELKENELQIKNRESSLEESLRILEQEKKNNEYLRLVNSKTEKVLNSAINSLKLKERLIDDGLNSLIDEFGILNSNGESVSGKEFDMGVKLESIKSYIRKIKRNEEDILKYAKRQQIEKIRNSGSLCKCGFPMFSVNEEIIVAKPKNSNESELVELEFRYMELEWERKAIEHTKNALRQEKLRQEEIIQSKEEMIRHKNKELENRLREVRRLEHILKKNMSVSNKNPRSGRSSLPNNFGRCEDAGEYCADNVTSGSNNIDTWNKRSSEREYNNENFDVDGNSGHRFRSKADCLAESRTKYDDGSSSITRFEPNNADKDASFTNNKYIENTNELTPEQGKHKINATYTNSKKLSLTTRMSPLLKSQRQRLKHILYEEELCSDDTVDGVKLNFGVDALNGDNNDDVSSRTGSSSIVNVLNGIDALEIHVKGKAIEEPPLPLLQ